MSVQGKRVAVVGRAGYLNGAGLGAEIDQADVVVRVNWTLPLPDRAEDYGARTDLVYACRKCTGVVEAAEQHGVPAVLCDHRLRKALACESRLDAARYRPNTGTVCAFDALRSGAAEVRVFGMDFYASGLCAPGAPWGGTKLPAWEHHPPEDAWLFANRAGPRFVPDPIMRAAIERAAGAAA